jgi:hypothetical protein
VAAGECEIGEKMKNELSRSSESNQIRPNQTKSDQNQTGLAQRNLDFGRAHWMRGNAKRMNGKAKGLSDCNTCFICDTDEGGSGLEENLRLSSLILA